jgi:hypothetical protein
VTKPINSIEIEDAFRRVHDVLVLTSAAVCSDTVDRDGVKQAIAASLSDVERRDAADALNDLEADVLGALKS